MSRIHVARRAPLLGTTVEVRVAARRRMARTVVDAVFAEIVRLEAVASRFRPDSELERWKRGEVPEPSEDLTALLRLVRDLQTSSGGAFNPCTEVLAARWRTAVAEGVPPTAAELAALTAAVATPRFVVEPVPRPTGDCSPLDLHAAGKGWIVDRALAAGLAAAPEPPGVLVVDAGGDLRHAGLEPVTVAVADPVRRDQRAAPVATLRIQDAAVATSGRARQGYVVAGVRHSHVLDPRTGRPVDHLASITVVAPDAASADGLATVLGCEPVERALAGADDRDVACLIVDRTGVQHANAAWHRLAATTG